MTRDFSDKDAERTVTYCDLSPVLQNWSSQICSLPSWTITGIRPTAVKKLPSSRRCPRQSSLDLGDFDNL